VCCNALNQGKNPNSTYTAAYCCNGLYGGYGANDGDGRCCTAAELSAGKSWVKASKSCQAPAATKHYKFSTIYGSVGTGTVASTAPDCSSNSPADITIGSKCTAWKNTLKACTQGYTEGAVCTTSPDCYNSGLIYTDNASVPTGGCTYTSSASSCPNSWTCYGGSASCYQKQGTTNTWCCPQPPGSGADYCFTGTSRPMDCRQYTCQCLISGYVTCE
ncbi:MAG: hypothetical protein LBI01_01510, partial [Elusimicrobium sp.]|nr:hypothetical protein [Elusimicrobium sp.]